MIIPVARIRPYLAMARFDHWFKNVFVLPGIVVAIYADPTLVRMDLLSNCLLGLLAMGLVSSSYYILNEILDAKQDALHPHKKNRSVPSGQINIKIAYLLSILFAISAFLVGACVNGRVLLIVALLWIMACIYNIPPVRSKDKPYLDVLTESINNPLRLTLGWYSTGIEALPPVSLVLSYWMLGAFFMSVKRFAELRRIANPSQAAAYRLSFRHYNEERLLVCITYYAVAFGLFFGMFLIRYRMELILSIPLIAGFIAWYIHLGFQTDSPTQKPEGLFKHRMFVMYTCLCVAVITALMFINIPEIAKTFEPTMPVELEKE